MIQKTEKKKESTVEQLLLQNYNQYYRAGHTAMSKMTLMPETSYDRGSTKRSKTAAL